MLCSLSSEGIQGRGGGCWKLIGQRKGGSAVVAQVVIGQGRELKGGGGVGSPNSAHLLLLGLFCRSTTMEYFPQTVCEWCVPCVPCVCVLNVCHGQLQACCVYSCSLV